ncbi:run domain Beclin-1-interacting and cysteine-rich domain-containing protein-like isoform X3 [Apostichopus japonicus]|uniref:run domain Beclin-1-interacting and cysteine-rich domain-containing protein-like isoform X3 n=1 Tax=Stichopus japonicus TaxID=307972 RepID=UPI003AB16D1B
MISAEDKRSHSEECKTLLGDLKSIVESLLVVNTTSVWSTVGGLSRLVKQLDKILSHGLKEEGGDYWPFILNLRQLQPTLAPAVEKVNRQSESQGTRQGHFWLQSSLEQLTVSGQLQILLASGRMQQYYLDYALVCQPAFTQALLTCLRAIEHNDSCLLAELDYSLFQMQRSITRQEPSFPPRSAFNPFSYQGSNELGSRLYPPIFIEPCKQDVTVSLSPEHALGSIPPNHRRSAKDNLESVLDVKERRGSIDKIAQTEDKDPLMNIHCTDLTRESNPSSGDVNGNEPSENGVIKRKNNKMQVPLSRLSSEEEFVPSKRVRESHQGRSARSHRNLRVEEDAIMEDNSNVRVTENEMPWEATRGAEVVREDPTKNENSYEVRRKGPVRRYHSHAGRASKGAEASVRPDTDYHVSLFSPEGKDNWERSIKKHDQFGSVKSRSRLRKLSTDASMSQHEKLLRRRNAHKRWHSEHLTQKEARRIMEEEAKASNDDSDGGEYSSSLPDHERQWYHGIQSPMVDGYFPQPSEGESLMSFLSSQDFATCPELDRENAHFCISEAIISAVEQIKCKQMKQRCDSESDASDEEIQELKQRIRIRRKERRRDRMLLEEEGLQQVSSPDSLSAELMDILQLSSSESDSDYSDNDGLEDLELTDRVGTNLTSMQDGGLSASMASLYSDADLQRGLSSKGLIYSDNTNQIHSETNSHLSAESIALSLLKKFSLKHLPRASELEWMVSEKDAPQAMRLRGNMEWAPPRAQLIFNIHPIPKRKLIIAKQNYRCAGCGMKIERGFLKRLRYCHYLGKFFCQCCHTTNTTIIPSRILRKWDFTKMAVSNFSLEFLRKIHSDPLFNIGDINPHLYRKVKTLQNCQELRSQLFSLKDFIRTCRLSDRSLFSLFDQEPPHLLSETDTYSIEDLMRVRSGELEKTLNKLLQLGVQHVTQCELCQAKGFICEMCRNECDVIFPFELQKAIQCPECGSCYHRACFDFTTDCPKCIRIKRRKILLAQISESEDSSQSTSRPGTPEDGAS